MVGCGTAGFAAAATLLYMNANNSEPGKDPLAACLQAWAVKGPLPPRFQEGVWSRIARVEVEEARLPLMVWLQRLSTAFARPALATSYLAVLAASGLLLGHWQVHHQTENWDRQLQARYVQAIDPFGPSGGVK